MPDPLPRSRPVRRIGAGLMAALLPVAAGAGPGSAQTPDTLPGPTAAEEDTLPRFLLEPLVVRVLRASIPAERVPFSIAVRESGTARPGLGLDESLRTVPGLHVENRYNEALGARISVRGFGARSSFGVRGVRVVTDGVPATLPDGQTALSHLDPTLPLRAEIVRGPTSSVHGNAAGGVLLLETLLPGPDEIAADAAGGSYGHRRIGAGAGLRVGGARVSGWLTHRSYDGFRDFNTSRNDHLTLGATAPLAGGRLDLRGAAVDYRAENPGSLSSVQRNEDPRQANPLNVARRTGETARQVQLGARWRRPVDRVDVDGAAWILGREVDNPIPTTVIGVERRAGGLRLGAALPGFPGEEGLLSVGLEGALQRDERLNREDDDGEPGAVVLDQHEEVSSGAAFAQLLARPHPRLDVLAGIRWDRTRFRAEDRLVAPDEPDDSGVRTMDAVSPSAGVTIHASASLRLHANVATAFETPTTTELTNRPGGAGGFNPELDPQRAVSFEGGLGWAPREGWALEAAAYRADVRNLLVPFQLPDAPGRDFFRNAGRARHRGAELLVARETADRTDLRISYAWTDARFRAFRTEDGDFGGNRVPGVPPHRAEGEVSVPVGAGEVALAGRWRSRMEVNDANEGFSPSYLLLELRGSPGTWRWGRARVRPWLEVTNVTDESWDASVVVNAFGERFFEPGPGRALHGGVRVTLR